MSQNLNPNQAQSNQIDFECRNLVDYSTILLDRLVKCVDAAIQEVNEVVSKFSLTYDEIKDLLIKKLRELMGDKEVRYYFDVVEGEKVYDNPAIYRVIGATDELIIGVTDGIEAHFNVYADRVVACNVVLYYKINDIELNSIEVHSE